MNKVFGKKTDFAPIKEDASRVIISYGFEEVDEENATWLEIYFYKKKISQVSLAMVKDAIIADINARTDEKILSGFVWNDMPVWLSGENQFNFKAAYDLAVQKKGATLPVTFKIGQSAITTDEETGKEVGGEPIYFTFEDMTTFGDFYVKSVAYINQCLADGWTEKDGMDWTPYAEFFGVTESAAE